MSLEAVFLTTTNLDVFDETNENGDEICPEGKIRQALWSKRIKYPEDKKRHQLAVLHDFVSQQYHQEVLENRQVKQGIDRAVPMERSFPMVTSKFSL